MESERNRVSVFVGYIGTANRLLSRIESNKISTTEILTKRCPLLEKPFCSSTVYSHSLDLKVISVGPGICWPLYNTPRILTSGESAAAVGARAALAVSGQMYSLACNLNCLSLPKQWHHYHK